MSKAKYFLIPLAPLIMGAVIIANASDAPEKYVYEKEIKFRSVKDFPPISTTSMFYKGSDYTLPGSRGFVQQLNPWGVVALDEEFNRYYISGQFDVQEMRYELHLSNRGNYRLCSRNQCFPVTELEPRVKHSS
ncbi:hypothetical protein [Rheinheimera sp.]|uniref:hypothetical protein n=1 Tax=Rheinheimera sp. TaxID=1869214 RepID=UPI004048063B